jgi:aspartyl-tRNA(Asn)/glutamyl-tRNA(Gln) amidotransferase subunit B
VVELPNTKRVRYLEEYKLWNDDARILTADKDLSQYFEELVSLSNDPKKSCSLITSVLLWLISETEGIQDLKFDIQEFAKVIHLINSDELSSTNAKVVIEELFHNGWDTDSIVDLKQLRQKNDLWALEWIVDQIISENPEQVEDYKSWNERVFGFFIGQAMKKSAGQWNPKVFTELFKKKLNN